MSKLKIKVVNSSLRRLQICFRRHDWRKLALDTYLPQGDKGRREVWKKLLEAIDCQPALVIGQFSAGISVKIVRPRPDQIFWRFLLFFSKLGRQFS